MYLKLVAVSGTLAEFIVLVFYPKSYLLYGLI
jgi:hypothetical protein